MKAAFIDQVGPPGNIRYGDLPRPALGPHDVLVKVSAVCVDPVDVLIRSGQLPEPLPRPFILGRDMAGVVEQIGPAVSRFRPGDRVWCNNQGFAGRQGTFAEYLAIGDEFLYPLPAGVDDKLAVAFAHAGLTAYIGLAVADLQAGETLFLRGGAGNVGSAVLQLATLRGAKVLTTAGTAEGVDWCRTLGARRVINYKTEDAARMAAEFAPGGVNVYWDTSGRPDFDEAIKLLAPRGRIILMAGFAERPPFPVGPFYVKNCSLHGFAVTYADQAQYQAAAAEINAGLAAGKLQARIDRILPLAEASTRTAWSKAARA